LGDAVQHQIVRKIAQEAENVAFTAEGKISLELVQEAREHTFPLHDVAFDLLYLGGNDLMKLPLHERRKRASSSLRTLPALNPNEHRIFCGAPPARFQ